MSAEITANVTASPEKMKEYLALHRAMKTKTVPMIWGPPGIGKSSIVRQFAASIGFRFIDTRLTQYDQTDIRGIPYKSEHGMKWQLPEEFPTDPNEKAVWFFDELPQSDMAVQKAAFQLILDRRIGQYEVPENVIIVAAGNRLIDRSGTSKMMLALQSRFMHYELVINKDDFINWALSTDFNASMLAFLANSPGEIHKFEPNSASLAGQTPRQWAMASDAFNTAISLGLTREMAMSAVEAAVGPVARSKFQNHMILADKLPETEKILNGVAAPLDKKDRTAAVQFTVSYALAYACKDINEALKESKSMATTKPTESEAMKTNCMRQYNNVFAFIKANFDPVFQVTFVQMLQRNFKVMIPISVVPYKEIITANSRDLSHANIGA